MLIAATATLPSNYVAPKVFAHPTPSNGAILQFSAKHSAMTNTQPTRKMFCWPTADFVATGVLRVLA
jgi:hypothetical protein